MSKREDFQKTMEENLALWHARVETIKTKLKTRAPTEKDAEGQKTLAEWEARSDDATAKLEVLKNTHTDEWDKLKPELVKAWEELDGFITAAEQGLRSSDDQARVSSRPAPATASVPAPMLAQAAAPAASTSSKPA